MLAMELSVIVVNFQGLKVMQDCLHSVAAHLSGRLDYDVWVVDNASTDGSQEWLRTYEAATPGVTIILNSKNLGFAAANNLALRQCTGQFVLLLNSDALLTDDSVRQGLEFLRTHPQAFGVGAKLWNQDGTVGPSYGHFPGPLTVARELGQRTFGALRAIAPDSNQPACTVDFPCGAYFLINAAWLPKVGLLDEDYFLYFEETDWARRAWNLGHPIHYLPQCSAIHLGGGSSKSATKLVMVATFYESWLIYLRKHSNPAGILVVGGLLLVFFTWQALRDAVSRRGMSHNRGLLNFKGLVWGVLGTPSRKLSGH